MPSSRRKQAVLSSSEQAALLRQPNQKAPTGLRNLGMLMLMLKVGLRSGEVLSLGAGDIDWTNGRIHIAESGAAKERTLWLDQELLTLLEQWRRIRPAGSYYFFTTLKGGRLKDRYLREMVKRLARKAEITKDVHPHTLRSTFAVNLIRETNDIRLAQNALGHRDVSTTQAYVKHLFSEHSMTYYDLLGYRRSGVPAIDKDDQNEPSAETTETTETEATKHDYNRPGCLDKKNVDYNEEIISESRNDLKGKEERREEGTARENAPENILKRDVSSPGNVNPPGIERAQIPALKCSRCSYILRYREDCPKCGASFISILEHWRKNV